MLSPAFLPLLDPKDVNLVPSLALLGPILIASDALAAVVNNIPLTASYYVDVSESQEDPISFLDHGASKIIVTPDQLRSLIGSVARDRLILKAHSTDLQTLKDLSLSASGNYILSDSPLDSATLDFKSDVYVQLPQLDPSTLLTHLKARNFTSILPTSVFTKGPSTGDRISIAEAFLASMASDRADGLFPTIVSSYKHSLKPLGLVYSSRESVAEAIDTCKGVYQSRKHGLWRKGETSGAVQEVISIKADCDSDALLFEVIQYGSGFCHLPQTSCFGNTSGIAKLEDTLKERLISAPSGSYTKRLFDDNELLRSKIMEEAEELCDAGTKDEIAFEAADLIYFTLTRCVSNNVTWRDIEAALDRKSLKITRRPGNAKTKWIDSVQRKDETVNSKLEPPGLTPVTTSEAENDDQAAIQMRSIHLSSLNQKEQNKLLLRPVLNSLAMIDKVKPIVERVRQEGDAGLRALTKQFDRADLSTNVLLPPFAIPDEEVLPVNIRHAIDVAYNNVKAFHQAQQEKSALKVTTMPGVVCSRFVRPIARVGIYVPGGTAILPSTAIMLGVPAQVAGCKEIVLATPPRPDGSISPEVLYVAKLVGVTCILKAGGAQAVSALAYGTDAVPKVDKIFGPGNQWVTAAKMLVQNDTEALVAIDMPAGPSEVLVIADHTANPIFVAADLLSQAEHGTDSQVVLVAVSLTNDHLLAIEEQIDLQARALPRVKIAREAIKKSLIIAVDSLEEGIRFSNEYAPEHLILHLEDASGAVDMIDNAGSIFIGPFSPESCGDYASGTNHTLPTNGFARQFSGVNTLSFQKHITSQELTGEGLKVLGPVVVSLAEREGLEAHANAVRVRLQELMK